MTGVASPAMSVIIPACCTEERLGSSRLRLTLAGYGRQMLPHQDYEVVVVDDGSRPPLRNLLSGWGVPDNVRIVDGPRAGMGAAYNRGVEAAVADLVLLSSDDEVPGPAVVQTHVDQHRSAPGAVVVGHCRFLFHLLMFRDVIAGELLPGVGEMLPFSADWSWLGGTSRALDLADKPVSLVDVVEHFDSLLALSGTFPHFRDLEALLASGEAHRARAGWLAMRFGNHSFSRGTWARVGPFDTELDRFGGWYQDLDLGLRLRAAGIRFRYAPEAVTLNLFHRARTGLGQEVAALSYFVAKHRSPDVALLPLYFQREMTIGEYGEALAGADCNWPIGPVSKER